jgi:hypothetical protein
MSFIEEKPSIQLKEEEIPKPVTSSKRLSMTFSCLITCLVNPNPNPIINPAESLTDSKPETIEDKSKIYCLFKSYLLNDNSQSRNDFICTQSSFCLD